MSEVPSVDVAALDRLHRIGGARLLRQMVELYLANGPDRIGQIVAGAESGDLERVERAAHTLKSSAGNVGATRLRQSAEAVESMVADGRLDESLVQQVARDYDESVVELKRALESRS